MKKLMVQFSFPGVTAEQYDQAWKDLREAGHTYPKGLDYHVSGIQGNNMAVVTVWESEDAFLMFGEILRPILDKNGFPDIIPLLIPVHFELIGTEAGIAH